MLNPKGFIKFQLLCLNVYYQINLFLSIISLTIKNKISEADYYEQLRVKWEKEKLENIEKEEIHYQDIKYDGKSS
jgi:hypothetical protein